MIAINQMSISQGDDRSDIISLIERQKEAWESGDIELLLADFANDCLFIVPGKIIQEKSELREMVQDYWQHYTETQIEIKRVFFASNQGAIEWHWRDVEKETRKRQLAHDAIIFELIDHKIKYWREYIDVVQVN